ncbi:hypothetical protein GCM10027051_36910 [Niabella terrae]
MKKSILLASFAVLFTITGFAQKYDEITGLLTLNQLDKAKESFDKHSSNEKFFSKPEGYLVKAALFSAMAIDSSRAATADQNRTEADAAFLKYKELDPEMKLLENPIYKNTPFQLYAGYYNSAINDINAKNYDPAFEKFQKTVNYSDLLIEKKILDKPFDTAAVYYTGVLAEQTKHPEEALKYYTRIADKNIKEFQGTGYQDVYKGLVRYYAAKNDTENFEKFKAMGKQLYPDDEFFTYSLLDFAAGSSTDFNERLASLEKLLAAKPDDYKSQLTYAEVIFDTLNSRKEGAVLPENAPELETKMLAALDKAHSLKPDELQPILLLSDHYSNKAQGLGDDLRPIETELTKKGSKATAADKQKLTDAKAKYNAVYDKAKENFEKAAAMFAKISSLDASQKRAYRTIAGNLAEYYSYQIQESKTNADRDKFAALEKKWDTLFTQLR